MRWSSVSLVVVAAVSILLLSQSVAVAGSETNIAFGRSWPLAIAIGSTRGVVYVDAESGDYPPTGFSFGVLNISSATVQNTLGLPGEPGPIAVDQTSGKVYVASATSINVYNASTNSFENPIVVGLPIFDMTFDNVSRDLIFSSGDSVYKLDPASGTVVAHSQSGNSAEGIAVDWVNKEVYVANYLSASVSVFNESDLSLLKTIDLPRPAYPSELVFDRARSEVFVSTDESSIIVLSTTSQIVTRTLNLGGAAIGGVSTMSLDERDGLLFVSSNPGDSVVEVDGSSGLLVGSFPVDSTVYQMIYDEASESLLATDYHQVTVIIPAPAPKSSSPPLLLVATLVGLVFFVAAALVVYFRAVTASGGRQGGPPSQPQTPLALLP